MSKSMRPNPLIDGQAHRGRHEWVPECDDAPACRPDVPGVRPVEVLRRSWHAGYGYAPRGAVGRSDRADVDKHWHLFGPSWFRVAFPRRPVDGYSWSLRCGGHIWWVCRVTRSEVLRWEVDQ